MNNPPKLPLLFLRWFCHPDLHPHIEGDLMELFDENEKELGLSKARWIFAWDVLKLFRRSIIRPLDGTYRMNVYGVWKHNFKMARRRLVRHRAFSIISIVGLGVGFAAFFIILQYVTYELSFDQFHENKEEIYRVICLPGDQEVSARNYNALSDHLIANFPEVKDVAWFQRHWNLNEGDPFKIGEKIYFERRVLNTSTSFFEVFPSLLKVGDPTKVLKGKNSIVISEEIAQKYFGDSDPIGQIITYRHQGDYVVSGISIKIPENSHFAADIFVPSNFQVQMNHWQGFMRYTYITLDKRTSTSQFESKLTESVRKLSGEFPNLEDDQFILQPITDIHLQSNLTRELGVNNEKEIVYFLAAIGILILVMAWFNHIILSTSVFFTRIREMGIRNVVGSGKNNLLTQFFTEYGYVSLLAMMLAAIILWVVSPWLTGEKIIPEVLHLYRLEYFIVAVLLFILGSIFTGLYPGILISNFGFSLAKNRFTSTKFGLRLRSILIIFQFIASFGLIIGVTILFNQLDLLRSTEKNINVHNVIASHNPTGLTGFNDQRNELQQYLHFKNELESHTAIQTLASSTALPGSPVSLAIPNMLKTERTFPDSPTPINVIYIDDDFFNVYGIPLVAGRGYSSNIQQDLNSESIILSLSAIDYLGLQNAEEAINTEIIRKDDGGFGWVTCKIVGVFQDYSHESSKTSKSYPTMMVYNRHGDDIYLHQYLSFRVSNQDQTKAALDHLIKTWEIVWPEKTLEFYFVDELYDQQFIDEKKLGNGFTVFAVIAVIIAGLGLLGITHYEIQLRKKEISIRKVMGSSISSLIKLMTRKYLGLMGLSILIATPLCAWLGHNWLETYAVRIELTPWLFIPGIIVMIGIILISSATMIYKAANANPTEILKDE